MILISESVLVYGRYVVSLLSVWVRDYWSAVGYDSNIVLMISFQSVSCRLSIGLKSSDSMPNLTRNDPDMNPTGFTVSPATLSVADSWPIHYKFCVFCRFGVGLAWLGYHGGIKWSPFCKWHLKFDFLFEKLMYLYWNFINICSHGANQQSANTGSDNDLASNTIRCKCVIQSRTFIMWCDYM